MEEKKAVGDSQTHSASPAPAGLPINWGLITGPVQPVFPAPTLSTRLPSSQNSAVHALQTKVKSLTQRRTRARDREKDRERLDPEVLVSGPASQISPEDPLRQRPSGKCQVYRPPPSWRSGAAEVLSSSEEEEEVEVQVRLEIHSPPAEAKGEQGFEAAEDTEGEGSERNEGLPCVLGGGTSLESLLSDNSSSSKDGPSPPSPLPVLSLPPATTSVPSASSTSPATSSTRRWAPPKGFWRVARPETLLLNSVSHSITLSTLPLKDYTQADALEGPQTTSKPAKTPGSSDAGSTVGDSGASSELKHSDSAESNVDRCEQRETDEKGVCSSDSWESMSSQSGPLSADERLRVKQRAYAKLRERQRKCGDSREESGGENPTYHEDGTSRLACKGKVLWSVFTNQCQKEPQMKKREVLERQLWSLVSSLHFQVSFFSS